jgi:hypothetical protein
LTYQSCVALTQYTSTSTVDRPQNRRTHAAPDFSLVVKSRASSLRLEDRVQTPAFATWNQREKAFSRIHAIENRERARREKIHGDWSAMAKK